MITTLHWRSGKFVYPGHSDVLLHYMALQDFSLEVAQNHSLIVALRMARLEQRAELLEERDIADWRTTLLSRALAAMACKISDPHGCMLDYGSGNGIDFEELKFAWQTPAGAPQYRIVYSDSTQRHAFEGFHSADDWTYGEAEPEDFLTLGPRDTLLVNQAAAVRLSQDNMPDLSRLLTSAAGSIACALRIVAHEQGSYRTTVFGREIYIPSLSEIKRLLRRTGRRWAFRWLPRHDNAFFLPETDGGDVGLLLAYTADVPVLADFKTL